MHAQGTYKFRSMASIHPLSTPQPNGLGAQFNLEIEEVECAQREIDHWRRDPSCPMTIEVAPGPHACSNMEQLT